MNPVEVTFLSSRSLPQFIPRKGVNELAKKPTQRIGVVTIQDLGSRKWKVRYRDPLSGQDVRRTLSGLSLTEVQRVASHLSQEALSDTGFLPNRKRSLPTVREAIADSIRLSKQRPHIRKNSGVRGNLFLRWLEATHPRVASFADLRPSMVQEYVHDMESRGLAHMTVRNHLRPVKHAWKYVADNYPDDVRPLPTIRLAVDPPKPLECLDVEEVSLLLGWLSEHKPDLYPMAVLQALAGLRMLEAASLRRQDIDLGQGTVTVTDTGEHVPKNRGSYRTIPVCQEVLSVLVEVMNRQTVIPTSGELFRNRAGNVWAADGLSTKWARTMSKLAKEEEDPESTDKKDEKPKVPQVVKDTGCPRLAVVHPHRLRSSFATMASRLGASDRALKAYLGHSAGDVFGGHYRVVGADELRVVSSLMDGWRTLPSWQNSGNSGKVESVSG